MNLSSNWFVSTGIGLIEFAATWWLQASVLLAAALFASAALRRRGPAFHSVIFRVALCAVLLCPLATKALTLSGASLFSLNLRSLLVDDSSDITSLDKKSSEPSKSSPTPSVSIALPTTDVVFSDPFSPPMQTPTPETASNNLTASSKTVQSIAPNPIAVAQAPSALDSTFKTAYFRLAFPIILIAVWMVGSIVLCIQLLRDLYNTKLLLRSSMKGDESAELVCQQIARKLRLKTPAIQVSPFLNSPCLLGHWRPTVLLPEETEPSTYPQVFLHELAHLRRGDWLWNLIGRVAVALLWSQPLIWLLQRRSLTVAEEVCDDYVIEHGCNRESYLRQLVEIAERSLPIASATGVSMVGFRTKLGSRAVRIMDTTRSLSTRAGRTFACVIVAATLAVTLGVALIEVGQPGGLMAIEPTSGTSDTTAQEPKEAPAKAGDFQTLRGRVLDPSGKPISGVEVYAENYSGNINEGTFKYRTLATTESNKDGSYELGFAPQNGQNFLIARNTGYGPTAISFENEIHKNILDGQSQFDLQLSKEKSIQGKILDTEGNPIPGVRIRIVDLAFSRGEAAVADWIANEQPELFKSLDADRIGFSQDTRVTKTAFPTRTSLMSTSLAPADVRTSQDGSFTIPGLPENSRVTLYITGPTIASKIANVVARDMRTIQAYDWLAHDNDYTHHGATATIVASPTQLIVGRIIDAETKQPLSNIRVDLNGFIGRGNQFGSDSSSNLTDKDGRFSIVGAPLGKQHSLEITPPEDQPYFSFYRQLPKTSGAAPIQCNVELSRAKWISGTIKDQDGKPMIATVHYYPFRNNPHATKYPAFDPNIMGQVPDDRIVTDKDGRFRIQAIPGQGILAAEVKAYDQQQNYMLNCTDDLLERVGGVEMPKVFNSWSAIYFDALAEVTLDESAVEIKQDLTFVKGLTRIVKIHDSSSQPLSQVSVLGTTTPPNFSLDQKLENSQVSILALRTAENRLVVLQSTDKKSGKALVVSGSESADINVQLEPTALVTGRVVDEDGQPVRDLTINTSCVSEREKDNWARSLPGVQTDADGKFSIYLPSGAQYRIWSYLLTGGPNFDVTIRPTSGATYNLGDLKHDCELDEAATKALESVAATQLNRSTLVKSTATPENTITYAGEVHDAQGKPLSGAFVSLIAMKKDGESFTHSEAIGDTKTDSTGKYTLQLTNVTSKTHGQANLVIRSDSSAISSIPVQFDAATNDLGTIKLQPQQMVKARLIDLEGNPLPSVDISIGAIVSPTGPSVGFHKLQGHASAWFADLKSNADGLVDIPHLAAGQGAYINVAATEKTAPQDVALNTGMPVERPANDRTYRPVVVNAPSNQVASIPLSPAKFFEGTVLLGDDQTPAANAKIEIWASQQELGSMISTYGTTDANGHFRLNPNPGIVYGINAYPPEDAPYQISRLEGLRWSTGPDAKQIKIVLPRGLFARGRVVDADSGQPLVNASVQYEPSQTNPNNSDSMVTGWQSIKKTNDKGEFSIPIVPGEGSLLIHANDRRYILHQISQRELTYGKKGGKLIYAHAFEKINPEASKEFAPLEIRLHQGKSVKLIASAPNGEAIKQALAISRLKIHPSLGGMWRAQSPDELRNGVLELEGLASDQTYPMFLLDTKNKLGATVDLKSDQSDVKVTLQPCGNAKARFIDTEGKPLANQELHLMLVATPGANMMQMGNADEVLSDEDFVQNFDRDESSERKSNADGMSLATKLIPGATYRYYYSREKVKDFVAASGETYDLGDVRVEEPAQ